VLEVDDSILMGTNQEFTPVLKYFHFGYQSCLLNSHEANSGELCKLARNCKLDPNFASLTHYSGELGWISEGAKEL